MLEQISWSQYWTTIGAATAIYYAGIGFLFYRKKIIRVFNRRSLQGQDDIKTFPDNVMGAILAEPNKEDEQHSATLSNDPAEEEPVKRSIEEDTENIRTLDKTTETGDLINEALSSLGINTNSDALVRILSAIIKKQKANGLRTDFRSALDWHMAQSSLDNCGISLTEQDLDTIWKDVAIN